MCSAQLNWNWLTRMEATVRAAAGRLADVVLHHPLAPGVGMLDSPASRMAGIWNGAAMSAGRTVRAPDRMPEPQPVTTGDITLGRCHVISTVKGTVRTAPLWSRNWP